MNLDHIEAFVYVIHFNSFNKAADALFLSQPSVSARIQALERELDAKLFEREGRHFTLTEKGKQFLPYAQQILQAMKKGKQQLQQMRAELHELRIGCTVSVSNYIVPEILPLLKLRYPNVQIKLITASSEAIMEKLVNKEIELGLVRNLTHPHVDSVKFCEDPIRLFVHEGHPFIGMKEVTMEDVGSQPLVFFECGSLDWMKIHRLFDALDQPPNIEFHVDNLETAKKLVLKQVGISFLPSLSVAKEREEGRLFPIDVPSLASLSLRTNLIALKGECTEFYSAVLDIGRTIQAESALR
ncbi:HTH-type transcriptional activator CmpR [Paenibacillus konkukensis]|uniref:HTH-type transcriptional activator CmpR n=1 Tax=Paenibacillus konkukensis TaxID=2020716 RepID=A0ABY4RJI9_9BACL|nr:LysR family transcriptional regulator [Paenibacillus konkukensis]UQZ82308.1 HTH-type transcriptional activator CmpR [Paenibacillus konkukensis]